MWYAWYRRVIFWYVESEFAPGNPFNFNGEGKLDLSFYIFEKVTYEPTEVHFSPFIYI